jgi:NhaA family Na+:H+ antiporter
VNDEPRSQPIPSLRQGSAGRDQSVGLGVFGAVVRPLQVFLRTEASAGVLLLACSLGALLWANIEPAGYRAVFDYPLALGAGGTVVRFTVRELINDGLMAIFFAVVGMEIKRELVSGELNSFGKATLPGVAAFGGMVFPAGIFLAINRGGAGWNGWGIPMATDIAFCVGILTLLKRHVPHALIIFVTALAIFDDIGGILVIAIFYGHGLSASWLFVAAICCTGLLVMNRTRVINGLAYAAAGAALWYTFHRGGIHPAIAGVLVGLAVPARPGRSARDVLRDLADHCTELDRKPPDADLDEAEVLAIEDRLEDLQAPVQRFVQALHPFVAFVVMPVFALANSGLSFGPAGLSAVATPVALGTAAGLFVGKQVGIFCLTMLAVKFGLSPMPGGASTAKLFGVSVLSGIGFTVALFIARLAYPDSPALLDQAKLGILVGSVAAGVVGYSILRFASDPVDDSSPAAAREATVTPPVVLEASPPPGASAPNASSRGAPGGEHRVKRPG